MLRGEPADAPEPTPAIAWPQPANRCQPDTDRVRGGGPSAGVKRGPDRRLHLRRPMTWQGDHSTVTGATGAERSPRSVRAEHGVPPEPQPRPGPAGRPTASTHRSDAALPGRRPQPGDDATRVTTCRSNFDENWKSSPTSAGRCEVCSNSAGSRTPPAPNAIRRATDAADRHMCTTTHWSFPDPPPPVRRRRAPIADAGARGEHTLHRGLPRRSAIECRKAAQLVQAVRKPVHDSDLDMDIDEGRHRCICPYLSIERTINTCLYRRTGTCTYR